MREREAVGVRIAGGVRPEGSEPRHAVGEAARQAQGGSLLPDVSLGISLDDGREVPLEVPLAARRNRGLLILGHYGSGKTWALKRLSYRLSRAGTPVAALSPFPQGYGAVAEAAGGEAFGPDGPGLPDELPQTPYLAVEGDGGEVLFEEGAGFRLPFGVRLGDAPVLKTDGLAALFVDAAEAFTDDHLAGALLDLQGATEPYGTRLVVAVADPARFYGVETSEEYRRLRRVLAEWDLLVMRQQPARVGVMMLAEALTRPGHLDPDAPNPGPRPRAKKDRPALEARRKARDSVLGPTQWAMEQLLEHEIAGLRRTGEGLLLRGGRPQHLYVDSTEEERGLFDPR
ncbi:MAG: hypothetical protein M3R38_37950 [Actinomycetota bacterium]|nr:hypothetical protein [Actinomycetota bacterium]